jgi:hypothetical protein
MQQMGETPQPHRSVFDAAVRLGLGRGTVPPAALALIVAHLIPVRR